MSLGGTDASLSVVPLEPYEPEAVSSDEKVIVAKVASHSVYVVNVVCVSDGEAWITVKAGDAELHMPALVGKARRKPTPAWTSGAISRPSMASGTTSSSRAISPATTAPASTGVTTPGTVIGGGMRQTLSRDTSGHAEEFGAKLVRREVIADAPAVPATGLTLTAGYDRSVILRWRAAPGAAGYRIARKDVATNTLETITGETVGADGHGLLSDTAYVDRWLTEGKTYAYYLATYFRHADGSYYFPDRASEQHGLATPREWRSMGWLPTGWEAPVSHVSTTIENGNMTVLWRSKFAAQKYAFGSVIVTSPMSAGTCEGQQEMFFSIEVRDTAFTKNIPEDFYGGRVNTYCFSVRAKFPDEKGNVYLSGYLLYVPVGRDCPSDTTRPCGPWRALPLQSIRRNQEGNLSRVVDEEP